MLKSSLWLLAFAVSGSCFAQSNVAELEKMGGKKMSKEDLVKLHEGGVTMKGTIPSGSPYSQINKPDGTVAGTAGPSGQFTLSGTWKIDDQGRYCHDVAATGGIKFNNCVFVWKTADKYYTANNDGPTAQVRDRQFVK